MIKEIVSHAPLNICRFSFIISRITIIFGTFLDMVLWKCFFFTYIIVDVFVNEENKWEGKIIYIIKKKVVV